ncbi:hypothetical protein N7486_004855 [Penicillium sp. IBT 16267x]|nr:hypothetical protein N7486_004855 [Penicillium sp. IBT 16267x]
MKVYDAFVLAVQEELKSYKLGDPQDTNTTTGPVISAAAKEKIDPNTTFSLSKTADKGNWLAPVVLTNVDHSMVTMKEETFGPVMPIMKVSSDDEAVQLMNDSDYGLTASVWTKDISAGEELIDRIEAGTVFINRCDYPAPGSSCSFTLFCGDNKLILSAGSRMDWLEDVWTWLHPWTSSIRWIH